MAHRITAYVRNGCKTCGRALDYLRDRGVDFETVEMFEARLSKEELRELFEKVGRSPNELVRARDRMYRELDLKNTPRSDEELLDLMVQHPGLIQRPVLLRGRTAVVGVKPEEADRLLD